MKLNSIEKQFESVALVTPGVFLLRPKDARAFVRECEKQGFPIAGVEGFHRWDKNGIRIQPDQELSADLVDFYGDTWERTLEDLSGPFAANIWFEVVIDESGSDSKQKPPLPQIRFPDDLK